jgi:hypothetical protein
MAGISSPMAALIGLPQLSASSRPKSSASASIRSAIRRSAAERSAGVVRDHPSKAAARSAHGGVDLLGRGLGQVEDRLARARVQDRLGRLGAGGELAVDEKLRVHRVSSLRDHLPEPAVSVPPRVR